MDANAKSEIEFYVSAKKLPNKDTFSKSDPFCVVEMWNVKTKNWDRVDQSETVQDNLSPAFDKEFVVTYFFEERQKLRASFYDADSKDSNPEHSQLLGRSEFVLGELVSASGQTLHLKLMRDDGTCVKKDCIITIQGEEVVGRLVGTGPVEAISLNFKGEKLDKKDFFGKSDP
jgi:Ca2+-dependent lipid-binding protein